MGNKRFTLAISLLLVLSLLLAACSDGNNNGASNNQGSGNTPTTAGNNNNEGTEPEQPEPPTEITIMLPLNVAETPPDLIKNELEKLTNTKLTYQFSPADTYEEKLNTAFATGSMPHVTYLKNQATFLLFKDAIRDEQFWEIGPYLSEFENLSKLKDSILKNTEVDGKRYALYIGRPLARQGMIYRKDWADKLQLKAPETVDDLFEMLKQFTENDPDGNNVKDTFGLADRNDLIYGAFKTVSSWFGTPNNWGEKDGQLLPEFMFQEYIDTMDYFIRIRDAGFMNSDFAATSKTDQVNYFEAGQAGVYIGSMQDVNSLNGNLIKNIPSAVIDTHSVVKGPSGEFGIWTIPGYNNVVLFPKMAIKDEDQLRKVLAFFDKMMTAEVANLMFWGIEGTHYEVVDGQAKAGDSDLINREVKGFKDSVIGEAETNGMYQGHHSLEARIKAEQLLLDNENYAIHDPAAALDSATMASNGTALQQIITDATYKYMYKSIDAAGFQAAIDDWRKRGGDSIIAEINESWQKSK